MAGVYSLEMQTMHMSATIMISGLSTFDAEKRLQTHGPNKIDGSGQVSLWEVLLRQVSNSLTISLSRQVALAKDELTLAQVLVIAMALSYGTLDFIEGAVITAVILLNIVLGFVQDYRAEKTMQSLLSLAAPSSQVVRNGKIEIIKSETLVVGDIVKLSTGVVVPADLRLVESTNLEVDEALLTGESLPSSKNADITLASADVPLGDRVNMVYSATTVTRGRATGIVVASGMKTQVGSVAQLLRGGDNSPESTNVFKRWFKKVGGGFKSILGLVGTPMQIKLSKFAILLFGLAVLLAIIVFSANKWQLHNEVVLYGICVAVAVIPESLIAVMTITIAVGVKAMAAGNVVIRKMSALEAIGGVTNICSDKTGTLTQGKMVAHKVWIPGFGMLSVENATNILDPEDAKLSIDNEPLDLSDLASQPKIERLVPVLDAVALCNFASVFRTESSNDGTEKVPSLGNWKSVGDPTEVALQVLAMRFGHGKDALLSSGELSAVMEHQFDSSLKRMSMAYKNSNTNEVEVFAKGASESILPIVDLPDKDRDVILQMLESLASEGLRVLCIATKTVSDDEEAQLSDRQFMESKLKLQGLVGLYDPPRLETFAAVKKCHGAGIKVHMLTGDHLSTATAIAQLVGILDPSTQTIDSVMRAQDFDKLSDAEIDGLVNLPVVLARCSPQTKVRMVEALARRKAFSVMTGDGVNDAPALKHADVGIAMGINDDNFASIVKAVEEGRRLFDNIQKFLMHLLISNIAQVILLLIALAFKDSRGNSVFPLSPLEILWVNMITSSFLALGLGMEEAQADIMVRPPRDLRVGVFTWELICDKMLYGTWAGILCLISFIIVIFGPGNGNLGVDCNEEFNETCTTVFRGRATVFAVLSFLLLVTAWEVKHFSRSLFNLDPARFPGRFSIFKALAYNRFLLWAVVAGFVITFPVIYIPTVNTIVFKHKGITWEWGIVFGALIAYIAFVEAWKAIKRRFGIWSGKGQRQTLALDQV
ncbi:putative Calcium-transporting ATPase 3 [Glarea lozoyensis 74030]|uniref:P-type Na(+) transporter n=1 Tax=Glarea lozoyensis (strain ATCC 74030 / MF5533) TaxID=1104152 RepID=H0EJT0_GLAL7|nr:putative Calcium-transporting ATPase 3 [Glarea lozoyensis 74030]